MQWGFLHETVLYRVFRHQKAEAEETHFDAANSFLYSKKWDQEQIAFFYSGKTKRCHFQLWKVQKVNIFCSWGRNNAWIQALWTQGMGLPFGYLNQIWPNRALFLCRHFLGWGRAESRAENIFSLYGFILSCKITLFIVRACRSVVCVCVYTSASASVYVLLLQYVKILVWENPRTAGKLSISELDIL